MSMFTWYTGYRIKCGDKYLRFIDGKATFDESYYRSDIGYPFELRSKQQAYELMQCLINNKIIQDASIVEEFEDE